MDDSLGSSHKLRSPTYLQKPEAGRWRWESRQSHHDHEDISSFCNIHFGECSKPSINLRSFWVQLVRNLGYVPRCRLELLKNTHPGNWTAKALENRPGPERKLVFQPSIFRGELLVSGRDKHKNFTPRKTNMSPKNQWLEDVFPIERVPFQGTR